MYTAEASIKYFITQALASAIILFFIIILTLHYSIWITESNLFLILNSSLLIKMGAAPFHFWFPEVLEGLDWINSLIILTWQKIAPIILLIYNSYLRNFFIFIIICCILIRAFIGLNQVRLRKILTYSSINHIGWILPAILTSLSVWMFYFFIYSLITINLILIFNLFKIFYVKQIVSLISNNSLIKLFFRINLFSLGGLPPFLGFYPKWLVINILINHNFFILTFLIIILTLFTLFYYIRLTYNSLTLNFQTNLKFTEIYSYKIIFFNTLRLLVLPLIIVIRSF